MYTRSRQNQIYGNGRGQSQGPYQNYNNQQGNYQQLQPTTTSQSSFNKGCQQNSQTLSLQEQLQQSPSKSMQQQSKPHHLQQQQTTNSLPQQQRLKPILKNSTSTMQNSTSSNTLPQTSSTPITSSSSNTVPVTSIDNEEIEQGAQKTDSGDIEMQDLPRWRRKVPGFKVNKKLKRLRMNQRLRKTIQPKNAIIVLNEMKAGVQFTFPETQGTMPNSLYLVHAELDGKTYVGQGLSKRLARQNAAENALKALLLEKMTAATMKAYVDSETDGQNNSEKGEGSEERPIPMETNVDENDEIPWSCLASFALHKLFLEWHNQGTSIPVPRPGLSSSLKGVKKDSTQVNKNSVQKELPANALTIHPVMLLNQMKPGLTYTELNRVGNPPNTMFTLAVEVDGTQYTGTAKNKKDAKKIAAKSALLYLYNLTYPEEDVNTESSASMSVV